MAEKKLGGKPKEISPKPKEGKGLEKFSKGLDKIFGPEKGNGSNRSQLILSRIGLNNL